jgi:hypothetical protein
VAGANHPEQRPFWSGGGGNRRHHNSGRLVRAHSLITVRFRPIVDISNLADAGLMNTRWFCVVLLFVSACMKPVDVSAIETGNDYSGLSAYERQQFDWAVVDVAISPDVARSLRRWVLNNVSLYLFRCKEPDDYYPASARMAGKLFNYQDLNETPARPITLTFYLPKDVQQRERYGCAAFDARGYSPVFLHGQTVRLPQLRFESARRPLTS